MISGEDIETSRVQQNYVEAIADLARRNGQVRTCDIAHKLRVSLPSVSEVIRRLAKGGLVCRKSRHEIELTEAGSKIALELDRRQKALDHFMTDVLGFEEDEAAKTACELEHFVGARFIERVLLLDDFLDSKGNELVKRAWQQYRLVQSGRRELRRPER